MFLIRNEEKTDYCQLNYRNRSGQTAIYFKGAIQKFNFLNNRLSSFSTDNNPIGSDTNHQSGHELLSNPGHMSSKIANQQDGTICLLFASSF